MSGPTPSYGGGVDPSEIDRKVREAEKNLMGRDARGSGQRHSIQMRNRPGAPWQEIQREAGPAHVAHADAVRLLAEARDHHPSAEMRMDGSPVYLGGDRDTRRGLAKFKSRPQAPGSNAPVRRDIRVGGVPMTLTATARTHEGRVTGWEVSMSVLMRRSTATSDGLRALRRVEILLGGRR